MLLLIQNNYNCDGFGSWFWWLIAAFLLGLLAGWLLRCIFGNCGNKNETKNEDHGWKLKYDACMENKKVLQAQLDNRSVVSKPVKTNIDTSNSLTETAAVASIIAKKDRDNLKKVEGIGPKIEQLLFDDHIYTWDALSKVEVSRIQRILDAAGPRYRVHKPGSWPLQAKMAAEGKWEELKKWQDEHKGGLL